MFQEWFKDYERIIKEGREAMTKEQEEAIEIVAKYLNFNEICGTRNFKEAIETVLNMLKNMKIQEENYKNLIADVSRIAKELGLEEDGTIDEIYAKIKEKDKEIEKYKYLYQKALDNTIKADRENIQLKKQIDLMAEWLYEDDTSFGYGKLKEVNTSEKIKQYFEQKSTNNV